MITQWIVIAFVVVGLALVHWADRARWWAMLEPPF